MRIILYTGKGGVGKTTMAAATGTQLASQGHRTLIMSTDAAHSLGDALETPLEAQPRPIAPNLWAQEVDSLAEGGKKLGFLSKVAGRSLSLG
ncbi:MAG: ArsA family ATPase [Limnochordia bacterium]|jgi:arsenite-transporting ATPase